MLNYHHNKSCWFFSSRFYPTPLTVSHLLSVKKRDRSQGGESDETKIWMATIITFFLFLSCRVF